MQLDDKKSRDVIFLQWIDQYTEKLLNRAHYVLSDKDDAKDVIQDVFFSAYIKLESFEFKSSPYTWLCAILSNKIADTYRKKYKTETTIRFDSMYNKHGEWNNDKLFTPWDTHEPENSLDNEEFTGVFDSCIEKLPGKWRIAIKNSYLNDEKAAVTCSHLGISLNNYWKILQRSRLQLRDCIDINWFKVNN